MDICIKQVRKDDTAGFALFKGEVVCTECNGHYVYQGDNGIARELVIRWGFRYAEGKEGDQWRKALEPAPKPKPAPKAEPAPKAKPKPAPKAKAKPAPKKKAPKKKSPAKKKT